MSETFGRTAAMAMAVVSLSTVNASAEEFNAVCAVFNGDRLIEQNRCDRETIASRSEGADYNVNVYRWATGGKTVTSNVEEFFTINGKDGEMVFTKDGYDLCVKNLSSGNTFCSAWN
ncbi:hypothetical protein WNZ14_09320 [Hoeflea sp. AS60]|uniref:hypothetical protein n=1 Tax=Hoeflea sp. AS60 TaxID=3135780 RepID=UPI00317B1835